MKSSRSKNAPSGWTFTGLNYGVWSFSKYDRCSRAKNNWYGWCDHGAKTWCDGSGSIKTKLSKCGKARLDFGNCCSTTGSDDTFQSQYVLAKLNGGEIGRAVPDSSKSVEFHFKDGDTLELTDIDWSVIEFDDFNIISCYAC